MTKKKTAPKKNYLPLLLLILSCTILISFWFFKIKIVEAPTSYKSEKRERIQLKDPARESSKPNLKEIDMEIKLIENQEKDL